jgi:hypothetical protein
LKIRNPKLKVNWSYDRIGECADIFSWIFHSWFIPLNADGFLEHGFRVFGICRISERRRVRGDGLHLDMKARVIFKLDPSLDTKKRTEIVVVAEGKNLLNAQAAATMRFISMHAMGMEPGAVIGLTAFPLEEPESPKIAESPKVSESPSGPQSIDDPDAGNVQGRYFEEG